MRAAWRNLTNSFAKIAQPDSLFDHDEDLAGPVRQQAQADKTYLGPFAFWVPGKVSAGDVYHGLQSEFGRLWDQCNVKHAVASGAFELGVDNHFMLCLFFGPSILQSRRFYHRTTPTS